MITMFTVGCICFIVGVWMGVGLMAIFVAGKRGDWE